MQAVKTGASIMRKLALGVTALLAASAVPALAQQQQPQPQSQGNPDDRTEVTAFTPTSIREIVSAFGTAVTVADRQSPDGRNFVEASFGQLRVNMFFTACPPQQPTQCEGLYLLAFWPKPAERNLANLTQAAGDFNRTYEFSKAGVSVAGEPFVARYLISDFGVKRGTLRREITNFVVLAQRFNAEVVTPPAK